MRLKPSEGSGSSSQYSQASAYSWSTPAQAQVLRAAAAELPEALATAVDQRFVAVAAGQEMPESVDKLIVLLKAHGSYSDSDALEIKAALTRMGYDYTTCQKLYDFTNPIGDFARALKLLNNKRLRDALNQGHLDIFINGFSYRIAINILEILEPYLSDSTQSNDLALGMPANVTGLKQLLADHSQLFADLKTNNSHAYQSALGYLLKFDGTQRLQLAEVLSAWKEGAEDVYLGLLNSNYGIFYDLFRAISDGSVSHETLKDYANQVGFLRDYLNGKGLNDPFGNAISWLAGKIKDAQSRREEIERQMNSLGHLYDPNFPKDNIALVDLQPNQLSNLAKNWPERRTWLHKGVDLIDQDQWFLRLNLLFQSYLGNARIYEKMDRYSLRQRIETLEKSFKEFNVSRPVLNAYIIPDNQYARAQDFEEQLNRFTDSVKVLQDFGVKPYPDFTAEGYKQLLEGYQARLQALKLKEIIARIKAQ